VVTSIGVSLSLPRKEKGEEAGDESKAYIFEHGKSIPSKGPVTALSLPRMLFFT
jgi:hypothetical protein